jgi:hypothetical protein
MQLNSIFMKAIKFLTNPYVLIISFLLIIISGESFGGFYLLYLFMALPYGGIHAVLAILGITLLLFSFHKYKRIGAYRIETILNLIGALLLVFSIVSFFYNDKDGYNDATFYQAIPLTTIVIFSILVLLFLVSNIFRTPDKRRVSHNASML